MKRLLFGLFLCLTGGSLFAAKDGYNITVNFKNPIPDNNIYLAHYYAKSFPTVYKVDSAKVIGGNKAVFSSKDSILGGVYMIIYKKNSRTAEFLLDNGNSFSMTVDTSGSPKEISFKNSPVNSDYVKYEVYLQTYGQNRQKLIDELKTAKTKADSQKIEDRADVLANELSDYRKNYIQKNPGNIFSSLLRPLIRIDIPKGPHYLADGKTVDSNFDYQYYKDHYWDNFDFSDNRMMFTPIYDGRLNEYFNHVILQIPDTVNAEADKILAKARKGSEIFKYTLYWLARNAQTSQVMGMDEVFVHLVEDYYMKGDAWWLDSTQLAKYEQMAQRIAPNVLGNPAPALNLQDVWTLKDYPLSKVEAPYTLVIFWSPTCGHCKKEIPLLDSVYNAALKQKGVKIYSVPVEGRLSEIQKFIEDDHIGNWINVIDANNDGSYKDSYDVYSTPKIYLLDRDKKIIGKGLDHSNVLDVIDFQEHKKATTAQKG